MTPALIMLVVPRLPSYNGVEVYYLKGVIGSDYQLSLVFVTGDIYIFFFFFFLEMGSLMTSSSSAGPIQISKFPEPWSGPVMFGSSGQDASWQIFVCRFINLEALVFETQSYTCT